MGVATGAGCAGRTATGRGTRAGGGTGIIGGAIAGEGIGAATDGVAAGSGRMDCAAGSDAEQGGISRVTLRGRARRPRCS